MHRESGLVCPHCGGSMAGQAASSDVVGQYVVRVRWMTCAACGLARVMSWSFAGPAGTIQYMTVPDEQDDVEAHLHASLSAGS